MELTWSKNFDIGNAAISFSKVSSHGARVGKKAHLRSIFGVCASARSTVPRRGSTGCIQVRVPSRFSSALPIALPTPDPRIIIQPLR